MCRIQMLQMHVIVEDEELDICIVIYGCTFMCISVSETNENGVHLINIYYTSIQMYIKLSQFCPFFKLFVSVVLRNGETPSSLDNDFQWFPLLKHSSTNIYVHVIAYIYMIIWKYRPYYISIFMRCNISFWNESRVM